ncbi:MAG: enoyl-ACP reductase [Rhodospirillaceae bacterium]|nr:enoyl-ACP reductase [Rhodospirillaceae bacterium]MYF86159.1 enoyl-ACP reductase [Rhodospirillaceae bacterium]MYH35483.1 enoyl-ACP reductase [Rhodospirillaceae bacterium]MYK16384.1 enoyl-ACP reductase [Rhodospirillaceae bacterium]
MPQGAADRIERTGDLMAGRRGLVMGVANERSLAWGIARAAVSQGAEIAFTYQDIEAIARRAVPLCESTGSPIVMPADVADPAAMDALFDRIGSLWGGLDFAVHSLAFSDRQELAGRYIDTSRDNFRQTLEISAFSFTDLARRAEPLMTASGDADGDGGGALLTLTFDGSNRVFRSYNVMGVAKAALEASVRYLANDLGGAGIRVNALSAGPMRTLAGAGVGDARYLYQWVERNAALRRNPTLEEVGNTGLYLISPLSAGVSGEVHHVDCGYNVIGMGVVD